VIIDTLKKVYSIQNITGEGNSTPYLQLTIPTCAQVLFTLLHRLIRGAAKGASEGFQGIGVPHKLLSEEKSVFEFIEGMNDVASRNQQTHLLYVQFLLSFLEYDVLEPHSEAFIRRVFTILNCVILLGKVSNEILVEVLPKLFERVENLIGLRYNNEACMGLVFPSKGSQTLFYSVGLYVMHFSSYLLNPKHFKQRMQIHFKQMKEQQNPMRSQSSFPLGSTGFASAKFTSPPEEQAYTTTSDIMFSEQLEFALVDPDLISTQPMQSAEIKALVWAKVVPLVKSVLLFNPDKVLAHNKAVVEDVVKSSQDLDMQVMNFITNSLLPADGLDGGKEAVQGILVSIIDNGCNSVYSSQRLLSSSSTGIAAAGPFGNTLSKYCLNNLFELCRNQPLRDGEQSDSPSTSDKRIYEIRRKIASTTTPVLINRCRDTLKKYASDEQKSGNMTLPRQRVSEAVFILEKLRQLDCYPEVTHTRGGKSKKSHLVSLMPVFADLVLSNEASLKEHLRLIFLDVSEAIAENAQPLETQKLGGSSGGEF